MFHRRLGLLGAGAVIATLGLSVQLSWLTVVHGAEHRAAAEKRLDLITILPTERGRILDRQGRLLAVDRPSYDVAVDYQAITGAWALKQAADEARKANHASWDAMSPLARELEVERHVPQFEARIEEVWQAVMHLGGLDRSELNRRLDAIKAEVEATAAVVWARQLRHEIRFAKGAEEEFQPRPIREQRQAHVILARVEDRVAFAFRRLADDLPGVVEVIDSHRRSYPWHTVEVTLDRTTLPRPLRSASDQTITIRGVADHLLGSMRDEVWAEDIKRRPFEDPATGTLDLGGYRVGDAVGSRGLERIFEDHLRGLRGIIRERLDTGDTLRKAAQRGNDLNLALDIALQARVQAILSSEYGLTRVHPWQPGWDGAGRQLPGVLPLGTPLNAAAVVLDIQTGEILAMVTRPTIAEGLALDPGCREGHQLWSNRPVEAIYPPGSIIKPLVLSAAVSEGAHDLNGAIECRGHFLPEREDRLRCWIFRPPLYAVHGELRAEEAVARSCNIFFYTLADELGMERVVNWYTRFGLGSPIDIGLGLPVPEDRLETWRGRLPDLDRIVTLGQSFGSLRFATVSMGIGQGPVTWTPLHATAAYAAIARGGAVRPPKLVRNDPRALEAGPPDAPEDIPLDEALVEAALEGLRQAVSEEHGSGHHIRYRNGDTEPIMNVPGVTVWAKTGTAQAPPLGTDHDCDGQMDEALDSPAHAWFVGLVGPSEPEPAAPRYAITVVVEYGGSGGRTAGPVANEIVRALVAERYLPEPTP
jgi:penicillin-binding protein 2